MEKILAKHCLLASQRLRRSGPKSFGTLSVQRTEKEFYGQKFKETYFLLLFLTFGDEAFLAPGIVAPVNAATLSGFAFHSARDFMKK